MEYYHSGKGTIVQSTWLLQRAHVHVLNIQGHSYIKPLAHVTVTGWEVEVDSRPVCREGAQGAFAPLHQTFGPLGVNYD